MVDGYDIQSRQFDPLSRPQISQKTQAEKYIQELCQSGILNDPVVTEIPPLGAFYEAEAEHKQFYIEHQGSMYCQMAIEPKLAKLREKFAQRIRQHTATAGDQMVAPKVTEAGL